MGKNIVFESFSQLPESNLKMFFYEPQLLSDWIEYFVVISGKGEITSNVFAQPYSYILFNHQQKLGFSLRNKSFNTTKSLIEPVNLHPFQVNASLNGVNEVFGLKVKSSFLYLITGIPLNELNGKITEVTEIFGDDINGLLENLYTAIHIRDKISIVENYFIAKIKSIRDHNISDNYNALRYLTHNFYSDQSIDQLLKKLNVSHRTLDRHFLKYTGITPKSMLSLVRFNKVLEHTACFKTLTLQDLWNFGYYDYAHFSKDFKKYYGQTFESFKHQSKIGEFLQVV